MFWLPREPEGASCLRKWDSEHAPRRVDPQDLARVAHAPGESVLWMEPTDMTTPVSDINNMIAKAPTWATGLNAARGRKRGALLRRRTRIGKYSCPEGAAGRGTYAPGPDVRVWPPSEVDCAV